MKTSAFGFDYDAFYEFLDKQRELDPEHKNDYIDTPELRKAYENSDFRVEKKKALSNPEMKVPVRFLIDECAKIGQIPKLEKLIATIRSREISACLVLQAQSQLKAIYKDNADTIIGNCDSRLFLGGSEPTTLKELSTSLGSL